MPRTHKLIKISIISLLAFLMTSAFSTLHAVNINTVKTLSYKVTDEDGDKFTRQFRIQIKHTSALNAFDHPVVIFSHGGGSGALKHKKSHKNKGQEWADFLANRGYIVINVEHRRLVDTDADLALATCDSAGADGISTVDYSANYSLSSPPDALGDAHVSHTSECHFFQFQQYLRARDVLRVVNRLGSNKLGIDDAWNGKVVVMGHSAGNSSVMTLAGATRTYLNEANDFTYNDPDSIDAFISLSPQSYTEYPFTRGYNESAVPPGAVDSGPWIEIPQPMLMITGEDDTTGASSDTPQWAEDRKIPYLEMNTSAHADNKYLLWIKNDGTNSADHTLPMLQSGSPEQQEIIEEAVIRFLDRYINGTGAVLDQGFITDIDNTSTNDAGVLCDANGGDALICYEQ